MFLDFVDVEALLCFLAWDAAGGWGGASLVVVVVAVVVDVFAGAEPRARFRLPWVGGDGDIDGDVICVVVAEDLSHSEWRGRGSGVHVRSKSR